MAKVKITGHASGSGVITVTAPNTSTDRTITLPDSTGTILDNTSTLDATKLSGTLPALNGASLTSVNAVNGGRKNLLINGNMDVWQRGTPIATMGFGADRWSTYSTNSGVANYNVTNTQVADNPISAGGYSYTVAVANADAGIDFITVSQLIEQSNLTSINTGDSLTLSFWIKKTRNLDSGATFKVMAMTPASSKDTWGAVTYQATDSLVSTPISENYNSLSTSWVKKTATFTVTANMVTRGLGLCFQIGDSNVTAGAGSTAEIYRFTAVQLEKGSVATDFEHRSYGEELALCQRYYCELPTSYVNAHFSGYLSTFISDPIFFPTTMRTGPTIAVKSGTLRYTYWQYSYMTDDIPTISARGVTKNRVVPFAIKINGSTATNGSRYTGNASTMILSADAEL